MMTAAILTISDSAMAGTRADASGPLLIEKCQSHGWQVVAHTVVPDEVESISRQLAEWADTGVASLLLTTGGTGVAPRDVTPEATRSVLHREIPGLAELMRVRGLEQTKFSVLSRAIVGHRARALIVNLPGSPSGAAFSLDVIAHLIPHIVRLLDGHTEHDGSTEGAETTKGSEASQQ